MKKLYQVCSILFIILLSFLVTGTSYADTSPVDSLTFENKIVELINKVETGIVQTTPVAYEVALDTVWIHSLITLLSTFIVSLILGVGGYYATTRGYREYNKTDYGKEGSFIILTVLGMFCCALGFCFLIDLITSTTEWVTLLDPRAGLALRILETIL